MKDSSSGSGPAQEQTKPPAALAPLWTVEKKALDLLRKGLPPTLVTEAAAERPRMRGEFLAWMLTRYARIAARAEMVTISGVAIDGSVDLRFAQGLPAVNFEACEIPDVLRLASAGMTSLRFSHCTIGSLILAQAALSGSLELDQTKVTGVINLFSASIGGSFSIGSCEIAGPQIVAIHASNLRVGRIDIFDTSISGRLALVKAVIEGDFHIGSSSLSAPGIALQGDGLTIGSRLFFVGGTTVSGSIGMIGVRTGGEINIQRLCVMCSPEEVAVDLRRSRIDGAIHVEGASFVGAVGLLGSEIQGDLLLLGTAIRSDAAFALDLRFARLKGACSLEGGFHAEGGLLLYGAGIEGELRLFDARIDKAVDARRARISVVHIGRGFSAGEGVNFYGSKIFGDFTIIDASFDASARLILTSAEIGGTFHINRSAVLHCIEVVGAKVGAVRIDESEVGNGRAVALQLDNVEVRQSLKIDKSNVLGGISLAGATIEGDVELTDYRLVAAAGARAFDGTGAIIKGSYKTARPRSPVAGVVSMRNCRLGSMEDAEETWPGTGRLEVDGLTYDRMPGASARERLRWLGLEAGFHAQPFEQLIKLLRARGDHGEAADVAIQKWRRRRALRLDSFPRRSWDYVLDLLSGYGYRPARPLVCLIGLFLIGALVFGIARERSVFCPVDTIRLSPPCQAKPQHPSFNPFLYSLETLVPLGDFGQKRTWTIRGDNDLSPAITAYSVLHRALGWLFALLLALAPTNILRRE